MIEEGRGIVYKFRKNTIKTIVIAAILSLGSPVSAAADESEELYTILKRTEALQREERSLLAEDLGWEKLWKAIDKNGFSFSLTGRPAGIFSELMALQSGCPRKSSVQFTVQTDVPKRQWRAGVRLNSAQEQLADLFLYADADMLAFAIPQLFEEALAIRSGSVHKQLHHSALAQSEEYLMDLPDWELKFVWDEPRVRLNLAPEEQEQGTYAEDMTAAELDGIQVEKSQAEDVTVYWVVCDMEAVQAGYRSWLEDAMDAVSLPKEQGGAEAEQIKDSVLEQLDTFYGEYGEEITVGFYVRDGLIEKIAATVWTQEEMETEEQAGETETEEQAERTQEAAKLQYEVRFCDPQHPLRSVEFSGAAINTQGKEYGRIELVSDTKKEETRLEHETSIKLYTDGKMEAEVPFWLQYDSETGDLDASLAVESMPSCEDDPDVPARLLYRLDSTFTDIEKGERFTWVIDELSVTLAGVMFGVESELELSAEPGSIEKPTNIRYLFEETQEELSQLADEVNRNLETWLQPETEQEIDTGTEPESDLGTEPETVSEVGTGTKLETEPETVSASDIEMDTQTDMGAE